MLFPKDNLWDFIWIQIRSVLTSSLNPDKLWEFSSPLNTEVRINSQVWSSPVFAMKLGHRKKNKLFFLATSGLLNTSDVIWLVFKIKSAICSCVFTKKLCMGCLHFKMSFYPDHKEGENCLKSVCERCDRSWVLLSWNVPCRDHSLHPKLSMCGREVPAASYCGLKKTGSVTLHLSHCHWRPAHCSAHIALRPPWTSRQFFSPLFKQLIQHPCSSRNGC